MNSKPGDKFSSRRTVPGCSNKRTEDPTRPNPRICALVFIVGFIASLFLIIALGCCLYFLLNIAVCLTVNAIMLRQRYKSLVQAEQKMMGAMNGNKKRALTSIRIGMNQVERVNFSGRRLFPRELKEDFWMRNYSP